MKYLFRVLSYSYVSITTRIICDKHIQIKKIVSLYVKAIADAVVEISFNIEYVLNIFHTFSKSR